MGIEIPDTVVECGGCDEKLNLLYPHLAVQIKATRKSLVVEETPTEDPNEDSISEIYLGDRSGRGRIVKFHDFSCLHQYATKRKDLKAKIEFHEEAEIYEPEDNRSLEQQVKDGDIPKEHLEMYEGQVKADKEAADKAARAEREAKND